MNNIVSLYQSGLSATAIAKMEGYSAVTILRRLKKRGVEIRSLAEQIATYNIDRTSFGSLSDDAAYWFGFLLADGQVKIKRRKNGHVDKFLKIRLSVKDEQHLLKLRDFLKSNHPIQYEPSTNSVRLQIHCAQLAECLVDHGLLVFKNGGWSKKFENSHIIRGLIDGDGWISWSSKGIPVFGYCSPHKIHVIKVRNFVGLDCKIVFRKGVWRFDKSTKTNRLPYDRLYDTLCLDRKWDMYSKLWN